MALLRLLALASVLVTVSQCEIVQVGSPGATFSGQQSGIGSWYQADSARDSTNGKSWCGFSYADSDPLFAPSLASMGGATYGSDAAAWREQTAKFCGLEARVTDPATGKSSLLYIGDAFAQPRSAGSIDIMLGAFTALNGDPDQDKDTVIKAVQWELTGNQNTQWMAPGATPNSQGPAGESSSSSSSSSSGNSTETAGGSTGQGSSGQASSGQQPAPTTTLVTKTRSAGKHHKTPTGNGNDN